MSVEKFHRKKDLLLQAVGVNAVFFLVIAGAAMAKTPSIGLTLSEKAIWDSNPLMLTRNVTDIWGSGTQVTVDYDKGNQAVQLKSSLSVTQNVFNERAYNSTDFSGTSELAWNSTRWRLALRSNADYDTTRTSEITTFNLDVGSKRRLSYAFSPELYYVLSPRGIFSLSGSWTETRYEGDVLSDYRTMSLTPSYTYNLTPLQQLQISTLLRRYESLESGNQKVDTLGPSVNWIYEFDPSLSLALSGGLYRTKYKGYVNGSGGWETAPSFSGTLNYEDEQNRASVSLVRSRQAYGNGTESYITTFSARENYKVNEKFSINFDADYQLAKQPSVSSSALEKAWGAETGLSYSITRKWDLNATYRHREETLKNSSKGADRDIIRVGLSYKM